MSNDDTREALGGPKGVHVREAIVIDRPPSEVYAYWRQMDNLPRAMSHLESVSDLGNGRSHWVAKGPAGVHVEWDAETINDIEPELIAWRSLPESDVVSAGSVHFEPAGPEQTEVVVTLQVRAAGGTRGRARREDPRRRSVEDDSRRSSPLEGGARDGSRQLADLNTSPPSSRGSDWALVRVRQPQLKLAPLLRRFAGSARVTPQTHLQSQRRLPNASLGADAITAQAPKTCPRRSMVVRTGFSLAGGGSHDSHTD